MAAPSKYQYWLTEDGLLILKDYAREGLHDGQIADAIGVTRESLSRWKRRFPELDAALKEGRKPVKVKVEDAFYSRCEWRQVEDITQEIVTDPAGKLIQVRTLKKKRWVPPDTVAMIFALKNLCPERFMVEQSYKGGEEAEVAAGGIVEIPAIIDAEMPPETDEESTTGE